ncbi:L domain-like protein [Atractiella rhizophila]|nr:L domain-like protein [Atractiella rhizophila]
MSGKIRGLSLTSPPSGSALKHEVQADASQEEERDVGTDVGRERSEAPSTRTRKIERALESLERAGRSFPLERTLSNDSSFAATPRLKLRAKNPSRSASSSANKTLTVPASGNKTIMTDCSFGVSQDRIIKLLTDIEPFEPNWEKLVAISLRGKQVDGVVRLKEFCPALDEVDLCENELEYLTGIPATVRTLLLSDNSLTSLTSFGHLQYLVRLDVSNNSISSVDQLSKLRHLRELKADNNQISSVDGLDQIDGLIKLSLKGNSLSTLDLDKSLWKRLELLDVSKNSIVSLKGLEKLEKLIFLNLDNNLLASFNVSQKMPKLRILRISNNRLNTLQVKYFPHLRTLFADENFIATIEGTSRLRKLENFSIKDQKGLGDDQTFDMDLTPFRDVRRLYIAGNPLPPSSFPPTLFLSLTYIDLSRCHLLKLPSLAQSLPNVRQLSLGYNYLSDLTSVAQLPRLRSLLVPYNRLSKVRSVVDGIKGMQELEVLDTRGNEVSWGLWWSGEGDRDKWKRSLTSTWRDRRKGWREIVGSLCQALKELDGEKIRRKQDVEARENRAKSDA